jgi:hypothetical protein
LSARLYFGDTHAVTRQSAAANKTEVLPKKKRRFA